MNLQILLSKRKRDKLCDKWILYSYRIERVRINMLQNSIKNENLIFKGMIYAIDIHRQAMKLVFI